MWLSLLAFFLIPSVESRELRRMPRSWRTQQWPRQSYQNVSSSKWGSITTNKKIEIVRKKLFIVFTLRDGDGHVVMPSFIPRALCLFYFFSCVFFIFCCFCVRGYGFSFPLPLGTWHLYSWTRNHGSRDHQSRDVDAESFRPGLEAMCVFEHLCATLSFFYPCCHHWLLGPDPVVDLSLKRFLFLFFLLRAKCGALVSSRGVHTIF